MRKVRLAFGLLTGMLATSPVLADQKVIEVPSIKSTACGWFDTGIEVLKGTHLEISATGTWSIGSRNRTGDANGLPNFPKYGSFLFGTLVGKIGQNGEIFAVGTNYSNTMTSSGLFFLASNDSNCSDNFGSLTVTINISQACQLYGVHDDKRNDSQLFTVSPETFEVKALGDIKIAHDLEALDSHPQTAELFAASGKDTNKRGVLYTVDKTTGELTEIGPTGFKEIDGISFAPDGTLWGWASGDGLVTIDTQTGQATPVVSYTGEVEDLTWNIAGTILYGVGNLVDGASDAGMKLLAYDTTTGTLDVVCEEQTLGQEIEALDTLPDDTLIFGIHGKRNLTLGAINPQTCQITAAQEIATDYNDVEGISWPNCQ